MHFTVATGVLLGLLGLGVGAFGTLVGAGGGFILTPVLLLLYPHDSAKTLTAISLVAVFFNASSGSAAYAWQRRADYRAGVVFALATVPGAVAGALLVGVAPRRVFDSVVAIVLLVLALWLVSGERLPAVRLGAGTPRTIIDRFGQRYDYSASIAAGAILSVFVGFASSFLGIGGGVIHVPLLVRLLGFPTHVATATSHFVLAVMSGAASVTHVVSGSFHHGHGLRRALSLAIGVVVGAQLGARLSLGLRGRSIELLLALALAGLGARLLVSGL